MATFTPEDASATSSTANGMTPAQILQAKHDAAEKAKHIPAHFHKASVEETVDEADKADGHEKTSTLLTDANDTPSTDAGATELSEKAKGKRKAQDTPSRSSVIDTQSEELFPSLGSGPKVSAPAGPGAWGNKKVTSGLRTAPNGVSNGLPQASTPISSGTATPRSGNLTPASPNTTNGQRKTGPTKMSLPGQYTDDLILLNPEIDKSKAMGPVLEDIKRRLRVQVDTRQTMIENQPAITFTVAGQRIQVQQALSRISKELTSKLKVKMEVPSSIRMHIIGKGGSKIKEVAERTGAKIQVSRDDGAPSNVGEDDTSVALVEIEGDAIATRKARIEIQSIVDAHAVKANLHMKNIPPEYFPFIAGPHNTLINDMQQNKDVKITVPPFHIWQHQPPPRTTRPNERPNFVPHPDMHISITGEMSEAQQVRASIERLAEDLRQQLVLKEQTFLRGQHQFIVGDRGMSPQDFLKETGCIVILPPSHEDTEDITIIGPPDRIAGGLERATALAAELLNANVDPRKNISNAPTGSDAHARALAQYFGARGLEDEFQRLHNAQIAFPAPTDTSGNWDIFSRDQKSLPKARADLIDVIRAHPPSRLTLLEIDPFFHAHLREQSVRDVRNDFGVHMIVPNDEESTEVMLVYDGMTGDASFELPRQRPSAPEIAAFEEALQKARNQILSIIGDQEDIVTKQVDIPQKFHDKVRKYVGREQSSDSPSSFPVRVAFGESGPRRRGAPKAEPSAAPRSTGGATLRGPGANVNDLEAKISALLEQAERDELERGYITSFDFPAKFNNYLIGKRGTHINELREKHDVEINTTEAGKVEIKGPQAKADACRAEIIGLGKKWEDEATYNLKIEPKFHRELIGRKGADVNRLQEKYNVRIQFPRTSNVNDDQSVADNASEVGATRNARPNQPADEVVIRGPRQGADKARSDLLELLQYLKDNSFTASVSVAKKQVPSLMGRGGSEMDRLRGETGAQIEVPSSQEASESGGRVELKIKGSKQAVEAAKKQLQARAQTFDDIVTKTLEVDKKHHQTLIGGGGANIRRMVKEAGGPENSAEVVRFPPKGSESQSIRVQGTDELVSKIVAAIESFVSQKDSQSTDIVNIPTDKHRQLIGRGGETRRRLEQQFKVSIDIPRNNSEETGVKISGAHEDVSKARAHIENITKEPEGETILVPKSAHHAVAQNGNLFRKLRSDHGVTVDHGGRQPPPRPEAGPSRARTNGAAPPLITDEPDMDAFSWEIVESEIAEGDSGTIPWILVGQSAEKVAAARVQVEAALEAATVPSATGYLILPDPKSHRLVIGAGGRNINAIRKKTGCDIQVPKAGTGEEAIVIVGGKAGCEEAKMMILDAIKEGESQR